MNPRGFLLFDIDGVIRDVSESYRRALQETVNHFCNWKPTQKNIDALKEEGIWNNDWDASLELIKRYRDKKDLTIDLPDRNTLINIFTNYYFGGDPNEGSHSWKGFIKNEPLLVNKEFFHELTSKNFLWGFVSGAEPPSARFVLETRLGLKSPPLIAMGDAPNKPDPTGLISLATQLAQKPLGNGIPPIGYVGDTVADVLTIKNAQKKIPPQKFISFGLAPPHLQKKSFKGSRLIYEKALRKAGADQILSSISEVLTHITQW